MSEPNSPTDGVDRIIDIARGMVPAGAYGSEIRTVTRIPYTVDVAMILIAPSGALGSPDIVRSENISMGGLHVISPRPVDEGSRGSMLILKSDGEPVVLGMKVIHATSRGARGYECGLEFEQQPSAVSMNDFRDSQGNLPRLGPAQAA